MSCKCFVQHSNYKKKYQNDAVSLVDFPLRASAKLGHSCELLFVIFPYGIICVSLLLYAAFYWKKKKRSHMQSRACFF